MARDSGWWSRNVGQGQAPPPQQRYQQAPAPQQQYHPQYTPPQQYAPQPQGEIHIMEAVQMWQGGEGQRERHRCPSCGSDHYFSRAPSGPSRMPPPAPMCYSCGYNGLHDQGDPSTWGATG